MLIIGCGNPHRGDDAAGLLVALRLRELGVDAREHSGEGLSLIEAWSGHAEVILVDAASSGAASGTISEWDARGAPFQTGASMTHAFGVAEAIALARVLERLPARLTVFGIEGRSFEPGAAPTPEVLEAVEQLARRIARLVRG